MAITLQEILQTPVGGIAGEGGIPQPGSPEWDMFVVKQSLKLRYQRANKKPSVEEFNSFMSTLEGADDMAILGAANRGLQEYELQGRFVSNPLELADNTRPFLGGRASDPSLKVEREALKTGEYSAPVSGKVGDVQFKEGLDETQKKSIQDLTQKPQDQWTDVDKANWAYATDGADVPRGTVGEEGTTTQTNASDTINYEDIPGWDKMTDEQRALLELSAEAQLAATTEEQTRLNDALAEAIKTVEPFTKQQIALVQDEISRSAIKTNSDYSLAIKNQQDRVKQLNDDLAFNKKDLSLEEQSEMSSLLRTQKEDLFSLQQSAAEAGLTYSTPRTQAEASLKEGQQGIVESSRRKFARLSREQDLGTERLIDQSQQNVSTLQRQQQEALTGISRVGEEKLGTSGVQSIAGVEKLGGIKTGTIEQQKAQQVTGLVDTLTKRPFEQLTR